MDSRSLRGIQEPQVWAAADQLLAEGLRPTIERVRQKIGSGSPNTVSPMLERWFATLGKRLGQGSGVALHNASQEGIPPALLQIAQKLWEAAREEAARAQAQQTEALRRDHELKAVALGEQQEQLRQREVAFEQARASLESALASSRQALASANAQQAETARLHDGAQAEIRRLRELLAHAQALHETQRLEQRAAAAAREEVAKEIEARHTAREHRLLGDIDRERLATRQAAVDLAKEQKQRVRCEEEGALKLEAERVARRTAEKLAEQLRAELAAKSVELSQVQADIRSDRQAHDDFRARLAAEERAHEATRSLLAKAIASTPKMEKGRRAAPGASAAV
jgi:hypothetical protein